MPEMSTDDTTITLARSENQLHPRLGLKNSRNHRRNIKTKKNGKLLKNGRLKLSYERLNDSFPQSKNYFDEVELRKKRLTNDEIKQDISPENFQMKRSRERFQRGSSYGPSNPDPSAENYITDDEINTRGYIDRNGHIHYSIPILSIANESKHTVKSIRHAIISNENSERSIDSYESNSKPELSRRRHGNIVGVVACSVGDKDDLGRLDYQVFDDGRIYDLKCSDGRSLVLSFSSKDASLVTNWCGNGNLWHS